MQMTDVAVVGGGLAGSLTAAMLGRSGIAAVMVDPHEVYPPDFRCEKLDGVQVDILRRTGFADEVLSAATFDRECWIARRGRLLDRRPSDQYGIFYAPLVNTIRGLIPANVPRIAAKATAIALSDDRQTVTLSNGETISARLVVLANGLNLALRKSLGMTREVLSECHSVSVGFDIKPPAGRPFSFPALTYYAERLTDQTAFVTLFPIGTVVRANLFSYRKMHDLWLRTVQAQPKRVIHALMPGLQRLIGDFDICSEVQVRPIDLCVTGGFRRSGIVLVGDAFSTSCPAAGTGARKALNDVERLCNVHIPRWLAAPGMTADKIGSFYADPVKRACDKTSLAKAFDLRSFSLDPAWPWEARRRLKFYAQYAVGAARERRRKFLAGHDTSGIPAVTRT
jgi:2-polyprenyl-6-methoxyphenol hydroxylase-like FAD-dependent oxidoreductase